MSRARDDDGRHQNRAEDRTRTRTQDQHQTRTRTRGADDLPALRRARGRGADDAPDLTDDNGGRLNRDARFEPGDDRRINGR